jgi:hypothetical protein
VVEPGADDLVAGSERAAGGRGEAHRQVGHARAERDPARVAADQRAGARARRRHQLVRVPAGGEHAATVRRVAGARPLCHRVDRDVDHLRAGWAVEPRRSVAQPGEALAVHPVSSRSSARSCS